MQLNTLKRRTARRVARRIGRGGSRGKTSGRGTKGQRARAGHRMRPEMRDIIKKLPKRRGFGKNRARGVNASRPRVVAVNVRDLARLTLRAGQVVTPELLVEKSLVSKRSGRVPRIKILSHGELGKPLVFSGFDYSESAREKIKKAGGEATE